MRRLTLGVGIILLGLVGAGCSLPEVYPLVAGPTGGPSPYGAWYEQHWATNAVLLAAAHREEFGSDEVAETPSSVSDAAEPAAAEATTSEAGPRPCCHNKPGCPHAAAAPSAAEYHPVEHDAAAAPAGGGNAGAKPATVPAVPGKAIDKVRY